MRPHDFMKPSVILFLSLVLLMPVTSKADISDSLTIRYRQLYLKNHAEKALFNGDVNKSIALLSNALPVDAISNKRNRVSYPDTLTLLYESIYLKNRAAELVQKGDVVTAVSLLLHSLPENLQKPERPFVEESLQMLYDIHYNTDTRASILEDSFSGILFHYSISEGGGKPVDSRGHFISPKYFLYNEVELSSPFPKAYTAQKSNCGKYIALVPEIRRNTIEIWDAEKKELLAVKKYRGGILSIAFTQDDLQIYVLTRDKLMTVEGIPEVFPLRHLNNVLDIEFSPDGKLVATSGFDYMARVWDAKTGKEVCPPLVHGIKGIRSVEFSPCGRYLLTLPDKSKKVYVWDIVTGKEIPCNITVPLGRFFTAAFSPCGNYILTSSNCLPHSVCLWDIKDPDNGHIIIPHKTGVNCAVFSSNGKYIATSAADRTARVWDLYGDDGSVSPKVVSSLTYTSLFEKILFSPDNSRLALVSRDSTARIMDIASGFQSGKEIRHSGRIIDLSFNNTGDRLVTVSTDSTAVVCDAFTGVPSLNPLRHNGYASRGVFTKDGKFLAVACWDGNIVLWDLVSGKQAIPFLKHMLYQPL